MIRIVWCKPLFAEVVALVQAVFRCSTIILSVSEVMFSESGVDVLPPRMAGITVLQSPSADEVKTFKFFLLINISEIKVKSDKSQPKKCFP